eukprot:TRINITY_DN1449_c0_g3_i1.p1 TRINITY_DN1449_c0_g3~~TRINITY_DN1449_c0_g3_i1.p1  ORF type:complete len:285 (+),score=64.85 TRINITY_DN1449_c0_g3_i1:79-933(+)
MASRDLERAREAFEVGDPEVSKQVHGSVSRGQERHNKEAGDYIKAVVFGGLDGIITTFAIIAAAAASAMSYKNILIVGFANLLGDAVGMAVGDYLSSKAEDDHVDAERTREAWEMEYFPDVEKKEMREIYESKGLPRDSSREVVDLLWEHRETFLDIMMIEELGLKPVDKAVSPFKSAMITFLSFMLFGGIPMLAYLCSGSYDKRGGLDLIFGISIVLFAVSLFMLGAYKGIITNQRWWVSGIIILVNGSITTVFAYFIGWALEGLAQDVQPPSNSTLAFSHFI